ncbi:hypothetical protein [Salibaculum sp.]|uniref:hypothetical protein n=1 Tax=Salibaculum sp. TaxID=2855480 RepID=UPI002B49D0B8|nr:hypothetical protein [Salibaculum sp.]HKL69048.1 hypothetical protein [Salibaculum sp.]
MAKLIAILNVIAWSGFWAFGYLAISADPGNTSRMVIATILAFVGAAAGALTYFWLARHAEAIGYAPRHQRKLPKNTDPEDETDALP